MALASRAQGVFEVTNQKGLHARAAAMLAKTASGFTADVTLALDSHQVNAKSVMGVLLLCGSRGTRIAVIAEGPDAAPAVEAIGALFEAGFGESD